MTKNHRDLRKKLLSLAALATILAISLVGCKNFMKSDDDVKETMQHEVDVANAPEVSVRVQPSSASLGSVTPNGQVTFKVNVPSTVLASETSGGFIKWAAFYEDNLTTEVTDAVSFTDAKAKETPATLLVNRPDVVIQAMFEKRPISTSHFPSASSYTNTPIRITFNKPINPASLTTIVDGVSVPTITISEDYYGTVTDITSTKYATPTLNAAGTTLTFMNKNLIVGSSTVSVSIAKALTDTSGLTMADDISFSFTVGTTADRTPPVISTIAGGTTTAYAFPSTEADRRMGRSPVYLKINGDDDTHIVTKAVITSALTVYADNGTVLMTYNYPAKDIVWSPGETSIETSFSDEELTSGSSTQDGLITFGISLTDGNLNTSDPTIYHVVRDTTPPPIDDAQRARILLSGATAGNYFNAKSTLSLSENPADVIVDAGYAGSSGAIPSIRCDSAKVEYRFTLNPSGFSDATTGWNKAVVPVSIPVSTSGVSDGLDVNVWGQLRDDLGNVSNPVVVKTINVDSTPPTGSVAYDFDKINGIWVRSALDTVPIKLSANADLSGVAWYYASESNAAPGVGTVWVPYTAANPTGTISFSDKSEGAKTVYVWFKDNADNVSTAPVTATLVSDTKAPSVSKFILRANADVSLSGNDPQTPSGTQYANGKSGMSYHFAFVSQDEGAAGLGSFTIADGSTVSSAIPIEINPGTQGSGAITVSNVTVADIGAGNFLVMGTFTETGVSQGTRTISLKVKDRANNEMPFPKPNDSATNQCLYDWSEPSVSNINVSPSDVNHNVWLDITTGKYYTNDGSNAIVVTGSDGLGDVSGLKCVNLGAITSGAFLSLPTTGNFSGTTATVPFTLTTPGDGEKFLSVAAEDNAGNASAAQTVKLYYDSIPPSVSMDILDKNGTSIGNLPVGVPEQTMAPKGTNPMTLFSVLYTATDNLSGIVNPGKYELFKRSGGTDTSCGITGTCSSGTASASITLPDSAKSATYVVYLYVNDKVENPTIKKYGFFYDANDPVIATGGDASAVRVVIDNATTSTKAKYLEIGGKFYFVVPVMAFPGAEADGTPDGAYSNYPLYVYLQATDKPDSDPDGSGIAKISDDVTTVTTSGFSSMETVLKDSGESSASAVADRYVLLKSSASDLWNFQSYATITYKPNVEDAIGRSASKTVIVFVDDSLPSATVNSTPWVSGYESTSADPVYYIKNTAKLDFTPADTSPNSRPASGLKGYLFGTSETLPAEGSSWASANSGVPIIGNETYRAEVPTGTPANVYLYLCDNAGNRSKTRLSPGKLKCDVTHPTFAAANVVAYDANGKPGYVHGSTVFVPTETFTLKATANDRDVDTTGSGLKEFRVYRQGTNIGGAISSFLDPAITSANGQDGNPVALTLDLDSDYLATHVSAQLYVEAFDNVGLSTASATGFGDANAPTISMDNMAPSISTCTTDGVVSGSINVSNSTILTINAADTPDTDNRPASGIKAWYLSETPSRPLAPTGAVSASDSTNGPDINTWYAWSGGTSQTVPAAFNKIVSDGVGGKVIYAYVVDNVGNVSVADHDAGEGHSFVKDTTPPEITITTASKYAGGSGGAVSFVNGSAKISFSATDGGSGVYQYLISSSEYTTGANLTAASAKAYEAKTGLDVTAYCDADKPTTVYLYVSDNAGNLTKVPIVRTTDGAYTYSGGLSPTEAVAAQLDKTSPNVTAVSLDGGASYDNDKVVTEQISLDKADISGVKDITLTGATFSTDVSSIDVKANGSHDYVVSSSDVSTGKMVIHLTSPCTEGGFLTVSGVKVLANEGDALSITAQLTDAALNESLGRASNSVTVDTVAPTIGTLSLSAATVTTLGWTNTDKVTLTIPQSDGVSHVRTVAISGDGFSSLTGATFKVGSVSVTPGVSGGTVTFSAAIASGNDITITGLTLTGGSGKKNITVTLTDDAGNSDTTSTKDTSIDFDCDKPDAPTLAISDSGRYYKDPYHYLSGLTATVTSLTGAEAANGDVASGYLNYYYIIESGSVKTDIVDGTTLTVFSAADDAGTSVTYHFYQRDKAGNESPSSTDVTFVKDATTPSFTLNTPLTNASPKGAIKTVSAKATPVTDPPIDLGSVWVKSSPAPFKLEKSDSGVGLKSYTLDGNLTADTQASLDLSLSGSGTGETHTIYVTDLLGNVSQAMTVKVYLDAVSPTGTLTPTTAGVFDDGNANQIVSGSAVTKTFYTKLASASFTWGVGDSVPSSGIAGYYLNGSTTLSPYSTNVTVTRNAASDLTLNAEDNVGNQSGLLKVTVRQDTDTPAVSFDDNCVSGNGTPRSVTAKLSDGTSGPAILACKDQTNEYSVDYTAGNASGVLKDLPAPGDYKVTVTDKVGNSGGKWFHLEKNDGYKNIGCYVNTPEMWTIAGSGPYTVTVTGISCKSCVVNDGTNDILPASGELHSGTYSITSLPAGNYTLKVTDWESTPYTFTVSFTVGVDAGTGAGIISSLSVLGSTAIAERLSAETLSVTSRKESFNRARSSSKTNLPVWFTDVGKDGQSDQKRSADRDRATSDAVPSATFGTTAPAARTQSIEALHAAALSGMRPTANNGLKGDGSDMLTEKAKATTQGDIPGVVVMTAPEGSPAFVAYSRGVVALRDRIGGIQAVNVDRSSFMVLGGTKREGFWERLLALFGVREKGGRGESLVGFAAN